MCWLKGGYDRFSGTLQTLAVLPSLRDGFTGKRSELEASSRKVRLPFFSSLVNLVFFVPKPPPARIHDRISRLPISVVTHDWLFMPGARRCILFLRTSLCHTKFLFVGLAGGSGQRVSHRALSAAGSGPPGSLRWVAGSRPPMAPRKEAGARLAGLNSRMPWSKPPASSSAEPPLQQIPGGS